MTGTQIKAAVFNLTKDRNWDATSDAAHELIKDWMSLAIEEFPPEAIECGVDPLINVLAGEHYELPVDFVAVSNYEVHDGNGDLMETRSPEDLEFTADGQIIYPIDIEFGRLNYFPIPVFEDVTDEIPINKIFHTALVYFFYAQYYYQSGEGDYEEHKMADSYMFRYDRIKNQKLNTLMNKVSDNEPMRTADAMPKRSRGLTGGSDFYE